MSISIFAWRHGIGRNSVRYRLSSCARKLVEISKSAQLPSCQFTGCRSWHSRSLSRLGKVFINGFGLQRHLGLNLTINPQSIPNFGFFNRTNFDIMNLVHVCWRKVIDASASYLIPDLLPFEGCTLSIAFNVTRAKPHEFGCHMPKCILLLRSTVSFKTATHFSAAGNTFIGGWWWCLLGNLLCLGAVVL